MLTAAVEDLVRTNTYLQSLILAAFWPSRDGMAAWGIMDKSTRMNP